MRKTPSAAGRRCIVPSAAGRLCIVHSAAGRRRKVLHPRQCLAVQLLPQLRRHIVHVLIVAHNRVAAGVERCIDAVADVLWSQPKVAEGVENREEGRRRLQTWDRLKRSQGRLASPPRGRHQLHACGPLQPAAPRTAQGDTASERSQDHSCR